MRSMLASGVQFHWEYIIGKYCVSTSIELGVGLLKIQGIINGREC